MSKIGLYILALKNNGILDYTEYSLIEPKSNGDLVIKENKTGNRFVIDVHGKKKIVSLDEKSLSTSSNTAPVTITEEVIDVNGIAKLIPLVEKIEDVIVPNEETIETEEVIDVNGNAKLIPLVEKTEEVEVEEVEAVIESTNPTNYKRPRGWTFRKIFVDPDGTVYYRGVEQPELKGTIEPSV